MITTTRSLGVFAAVSAGLIIAATVGLRMVFESVEQQNAMLVSAGLAFAVQLGAYALLAPAKAAKGAAAGELIVRWGMGAVMRLVVLVLYAVLARVMHLPLDAALVSFGVFLFLTMMAEPLLLNYER